MRSILHADESITVNERMVLDIVRRHRHIMRSAVSPQTNLTQPSVHRIIDSLLERGCYGWAKASCTDAANPARRWS